MSMEKPASTLLPSYLWLQAVRVSLKLHIPRRKHGSEAPADGQEHGEKDTAAKTMCSREPGQEAVVMVST